jgi:hypothetical protein
VEVAAVDCFLAGAKGEHRANFRKFEQTQQGEPFPILRLVNMSAARQGPRAAGGELRGPLRGKRSGYAALASIPETTKGYFMKTASQELTLSGALSDPLIRTLMTADNVDPVKLESMLRRIAEELKPSLSPSTEGSAAIGRMGRADRCLEI